jgi:hypothetical protein
MVYLDSTIIINGNSKNGGGKESLFRSGFTGEDSPDKHVGYL